MSFFVCHYVIMSSKPYPVSFCHYVILSSKKSFVSICHYVILSSKKSSVSICHYVILSSKKSSVSIRHYVILSSKKSFVSICHYVIMSPKNHLSPFVIMSFCLKNLLCLRPSLCYSVSKNSPVFVCPSVTLSPIYSVCIVLKSLDNDVYKGLG